MGRGGGRNRIPARRGRDGQARETEEPEGRERQREGEREAGRIELW